MKPALVVSLLLLVPSVALAQPADASRLFSHQASVAQQSAQSYRLPLGPDVLAICRADLSDVLRHEVTGPSRGVRLRTEREPHPAHP